MRETPLATAHVRIARPTDHLGEVVEFYKAGLGFVELGSFVDHNGFDGVMLGHPTSCYHLEFTHAQGHKVGKAPTQDHLLVFYLPNKSDWQQVVERLETLGSTSVRSFNPYWDLNGKTYEDPDGYRIVLQNAEWNTSPGTAEK